MKIVPRDYQDEADASVEGAFAEGTKRVAVVAATGLGKTTMMAMRAWREVDAGGRVLILCHRYELLEQITARLIAMRGGWSIGRIAAGRKTMGMPIDVAMTPTLSARGARLATSLGKDYTLVLYDEFHHAPAKGNAAVLTALGCMPDSAEGGAVRTRLVGYTATLTRAERKGYGTADVCDQVVYERGIGWAVSHRTGPDGYTSVPVREGEVGHLVRPYGQVVVAPHLDLAGVRKNASGDYADGELGEMVTQDMDEIVRAFMERDAKDPRQTSAFWPTVEAAELATERMLAAGMPAATVTGKTPLGDGPEQRGDAAKGTGLYGALATGKIKCLNGVMVTTEGWDCPPVSRILMARPTRLPGLYQQIVGRGLRPCPEIGKRDCEVLDVVGAVRGQTLATLADLLPGVVYDSSLLDQAPCASCGGYTREALAARRAEGLGGQPCVCVGDVDRDPDGGRRKLRGPAEYEFVDMLGSRWLWLQTASGTPVLTAGVRFVALRELPDGTWRAGHMALSGPVSLQWRRRDAKVLADGVTLDQARQAAETWAEQETARTERASWNRNDRSWRKARKSPSQAQRDFAAKLGIEVPPGVTSRDLSDMITLTRIAQRGIR